MRVLLSTLIQYTRIRLQPLTVFLDSVFKKEIDIKNQGTYIFGPLRPINVASTVRIKSLRAFSRKVDRVWVFTKTNNPNKLYVDSNKGLFLSAGIILKFTNLDQKRFLKKRLRTWHGYVKALGLLQRRAFAMHFSDLYGKKSIFLNKLGKSSVRIAWLHVRLFYNSVSLQVKTSRRIKRWIKKKYYQLGVGEMK